MIDFACPYCFTKLNNLICPTCSFVGRFEEGIYHLHRTDETWQKCLGQIEAVGRADEWFRKEHQGQPDEGGKTNEDNDKMQDKIIEIMGGVKDKVFLDLGGGTGQGIRKLWAISKFIDKGASLGFVLDIDKNRLVPSEKNIVSILGDGYYLPFIDNCFDFVFDCSTLHHFEDMVAVLKQICRVLKNGGYYVSQGNPHRTGIEETDRKRYWDDFGLIEIMPTAEEYKNYFMEAFANVEFVPIEKNMVMYAVKH